MKNVKGTHEDFHKIISSQIEAMNECVKQHGARQCVYENFRGPGVSTDDEKLISSWRCV